MELEVLFLYLTASQQLDRLDLIQARINVLLGDDEHKGLFPPGAHCPPLQGSPGRELLEVRDLPFSFPRVHV